MARVLLVVPTGHGAGLTSTCLGLVRALDARGVAVGFHKPLAQPTRATGPDRSVALVRLTTALDPSEPIPASRVVERLSRGDIDDLMEEVVAAAEGVLAAHDVVVVEGLAPSADQVFSGRVNQALATALDADVLLVGSAGVDGTDPGAPERIAEDMAVTAGTYRTGEALRVIGGVVSRWPVPEDPETAVARVARLRGALEHHGIPLVGAVPFRADLVWARVRDLVHDLDVEVLTHGDQGRRIKEVVVAAQAVPGMLPLLREGRLILVPGDRHDVVMATCLAALNGNRLAGLLLTAGVGMDPRVAELTAAAAATGLPILRSDRSTYATATAVNRLDPEVPADDAERALAVSTTVADALDPGWLAKLPTASHTPRLSPAAFRRRLTTLAAERVQRIVLPEGAEPRTVQAAAICAERGIARPVLLAHPDEVASVAAGLGLTLPEGVEVLDPAGLVERYVDVLVEARKHKGMQPDVARDSLADPIWLGTTMLQAGDVDGLVAGAVHTTAATVRPALQVVRTKPGARLVSSVFFMCLPDDVVIYGDCAVNPDPGAEDLADIALQSAASARAFGIEPRVAMISFSTGSSGSGSSVDKVAEATRIARERDPDLIIDGPLQYDAAAVASVAASKAPDSPVAGRATVFVFPDLNTGNTTYKAVQRNAGVISVGPMLQGLAKPVNDLSRGALVDDIVYTIALTAIQASRG
ncbi:phosphate acetyltransferase [Kineococcus radiotolerans]|uniref:Phosphate acetyltransferase n=2 Tax=Kineococcus radiotolerans TaxID=131568 RepID=A6W6A6_KINRD|nr:phosphate acetyltransferase [Kineococcus radiotolerans]ABS02345.1 phosphate acetyltransferase [Kineococcus radiotolerans SRS30216 = ATCC BAA-149]MBB2900463.1 phosphate acetyltransferase [Kineococcus radiotolerans]